MTHHGTSWTERTKAPDYVPAAPPPERYPTRQAFHRPHTSLGAAGHWLHLAGVMAPVVLGELISDAVKYKKAVRLVSVATALGYEALYTMREQKRREEQDARLAECRGRE